MEQEENQAIQGGESMARKAKAVPGSAGGGDTGKLRTREHVIADLSVNYMERLVLKCGFVARRLVPD